MLIIVSKNITTQALKKLEKYGEVLCFGTEGITYEAISCHPDIFFCTSNGELIAAPNTPDTFLNLLTERKIPFTKGCKSIENTYPNSACYNAVVAGSTLIYNKYITDKRISENPIFENKIHTEQGYIRCNLLALSNKTFMTSDRGILNALANENSEILYINPTRIKLRGFRNGFFGGCCGVSNEYVFVNGALKYFTEKESIIKFIEQSGKEVIALNDKIPEDLGSLLIVENL